MLVRFRIFYPSAQHPTDFVQARLQCQVFFLVYGPRFEREPDEYAHDVDPIAHPRKQDGFVVPVRLPGLQQDFQQFEVRIFDFLPKRIPFRFRNVVSEQVEGFI